MLGVTPVARPELGGAIVADNLVDFERDYGSSVVSGTLRSRVVREYAAGTLDFYFQIVLDPDSAPVAGLSTAAFSRWQTDVDNRLDGSGGVALASAARTGDGSTLALSFPSGGLPGGATSRFAFVRTDATAYDAAGIATLGAGPAGDIGVTASTFRPVAAAPPPAVPLPPAAYTGATGLAAAAAAALRRRSPWRTRDLTAGTGAR